VLHSLLENLSARYLSNITLKIFSCDRNFSLKKIVFENEFLSSCVTNRLSSPVTEPTSSYLVSKDDSEEGKSPGFVKVSAELFRPFPKCRQRKTGGWMHGKSGSKQTRQRILTLKTKGHKSFKDNIQGKHLIRKLYRRSWLLLTTMKRFCKSFYTQNWLCDISCKIICECCWNNFFSWWFCKRKIYFSKSGRKRSISYYTAEVTNEFNGYEGGMKHCRRLEITSKFIVDTKYEYFSILRSDKLRNLPPPWLSSLSKCQAPQLLCPVDFSEFSASVATQNV